MLTPSGVTIAEYNNAINAGNKQHVKLVFPNQNLTIGEDHIVLGGFRVDSVLNGEDDLSFGKAVSSEINVTLFNHDGSLSGVNYADEFKAYIGVEINLLTQWVCVGTFIGEKPSKVLTSTISLRGLDKMKLLDTDAKEFLDSLNYSQTLGSIFDAIAGAFNLTPVRTAANANAGITITSSPFGGNGITYRDLVGWIAEACGCYARIGTGGDTLEMVWYADHTADYAIDKTKYFSIDVAEYTVPAIDSVNIKVTEADVGATYPASGTHDNVYQIIDNPYLYGQSAAQISGYAENIYTRLSAFGSYKPIAVECIGNWLVQPGDIIAVTEMDGTTVDAMPVFRASISFNGRARATFECTGNETRDVQNYSARELTRYNYKIHELITDIDELRSEIISISVHVYVQPTDPRLDGVTLVPGDFWVKKSIFTGKWRGVAQHKWGTVSNYVWHELANIDPKTYCWDGTQWLPVADMSEVTQYSTKIEQNSRNILLCATIDGLRSAGSVLSVGSYISISGRVLDINTDGQLNIKAGADLNVEGGADINVQANGNINVASGGNMNVNSGGNLNVNSGGAIKVKSGADLNVESGGDINIASGGKINVQSGGSIGLASGGNFTINSGGTFSVASGGTLSVKSGGNLSIASGGAFTISSGGNFNINSGGNFTIKAGGKLTLATSNSLVISSGNFQIDTSGNVTITGTFNSGNWKFNSNGLRYYNGNSVYLGIERTNAAYGTDADELVIHAYDRAIVLTPGLDGCSLNVDYGGQIVAGGPMLVSLVPHVASGYFASVGSPSTPFNYGYISTIVNNSSRRVKHDIKDLPELGDEIDSLRPVSFIYNNDILNKKRYGLIYEEARDVLPDVCFDGVKPEQSGINYMDLVPVLLKEIQSLRKRVSELEKKGV